MNDIENALDDIEKKTTMNGNQIIKFVRIMDAEVPPDHYIYVIRGDGCYSHVGRVDVNPDGRQDLSIGDGCFKRGQIQHEFMHALGN